MHIDARACVLTHCNCTIDVVTGRQLCSGASTTSCTLPFTQKCFVQICEIQLVHKYVCPSM